MDQENSRKLAEAKRISSLEENGYKFNTVSSASGSELIFVRIPKKTGGYKDLNLGTDLSQALEYIGWFNRGRHFENEQGNYDD